jgi:hypothetical protein
MLKFSLLPHLYCDIRLLSVQLLASEVQSSAFTLHYLLTSAAYTVGEKERSEPETDYTFQSLCYINWATQNYELYGEAIFVCCIVCTNLFIA